MDGEFPDFKARRSWPTVKEYWPQQLVHVPSMTSISRDENNVYTAGGIDFHKPAYNILSYTWGRWRIHESGDSPSLALLGTPWEIPAIAKKHFTVAAFRKVIEAVVGMDVIWVWVDVGCIDQRNNEQTALEIGCQASIFRLARTPYVWLSQTPIAKLSPAIGLVTELSNNQYKLYDLTAPLEELRLALIVILRDP
ncbi:hypothetical protein EV127DRAFT_504438 [Xylaria flabelliformis]|nr:hypothetical protein EV127DRAFT_504438 [Xylaria flabelliformis]